MPLLFCQSLKCCGHEMSLAQILDDIDRWPRHRMVARPATPRRPRKSFSIVAVADRRAAIARVDAGESVMRVAAAVGVSRTTVYNWRIRRKDLEAL